MPVNVEVIQPKFDGGATFCVPFQLTLGAPNATWLNALNISTRNWTYCLSLIRKFLMAEKSLVTVCGSIMLSRPQFPNEPERGLENAAALYQPKIPGLDTFGLKPVQLSRELGGAKLVPPESHEDAFVGRRSEERRVGKECR